MNEKITVVTEDTHCNLCKKPMKIKRVGWDAVALENGVIVSFHDHWEYCSLTCYLRANHAA